LKSATMRYILRCGKHSRDIGMNCEFRAMISVLRLLTASITTTEAGRRRGLFANVHLKHVVGGELSCDSSVTENQMRLGQITVPTS
ncbi:MAG: hypothetical protein ABEI52_08735, partial [Halobacteriaceae archaeon]